MKKKLQKPSTIAARAEKKSKPVVKKTTRGAREKNTPGAKANNSRPSLAGHWVTRDELNHVVERLREAQDTLDAIRNGAVDAVVVSGANGNHIYSLTGAEQPYRVYVEHMQEGAATVAADGLVLYCNKRFASMVGTPLERVIGSQITQYLSERSWEKISVIFKKQKESVKCEDEMKGRHKRLLPVNFTASLLPMDDQDVMCLVITDLTNQRAHENLRLEKDLVEKASLAKDSFLATLSHELRTPLTPVLITAATLEESAEIPPHIKQDIAMIRRNIELEARLIDDLLDLTRISHGKFELHMAPMDVHAVLSRAVEICRSSIDAKQQKLHLKLNATNTKTVGDAVRLQQVMWNVIRNAVKFTPPGGTITITTNDIDNQFRFRIKDTGIGFDAAAKPKLFHAFEQAGRDITRQFGGLGLGLTISRSIVQAHGGQIIAESKGFQQGATFTITLPLRELGSTQGGYAIPETGEVTARRLRILFVEDHADTRASMQRLLQRLNHDVVTVESGTHALEQAASEQFDLVISDLGLPDMSGLELMQQLRDRFGLKGIAVSGYGMEQDVNRSLEAGFQYHLTKPIKFEILRNLISEIASAWSKGG